MSFSHRYTRSFESPLEAEQSRKLLADLTMLSNHQKVTSIRSKLLSSPLRWIGSRHGETLYLFRQVGPNLLPPPFGVEIRAQVTPNAQNSSVNLRARPNRWLWLAALWWTVVPVALVVSLFVFHQLNGMALFFTLFFGGMAVFQHVSIRQACVGEMEFISRLLGDRLP